MVFLDCLWIIGLFHSWWSYWIRQSPSDKTVFALGRSPRGRREGWRKRTLSFPCWPLSPNPSFEPRFAPFTYFHADLFASCCLSQSVVYFYNVFSLGIHAAHIWIYSFAFLATKSAWGYLNYNYKSLLNTRLSFRVKTRQHRQESISPLARTLLVRAMRARNYQQQQR